MLTGQAGRMRPDPGQTSPRLLAATALLLGVEAAMIASMALHAAWGWHLLGVSLVSPGV